MAEYIEREAAEKVASQYGCDNGSALGKHSGIADCIAYEISKIPAADVAPVVRCHECIYSTNSGNDILFCDHFERDMMPDDFCSCGARMDLEDEAE